MRGNNPETFRCVRCMGDTVENCILLLTIREDGVVLVGHSRLMDCYSICFK